MRIAIPTVQGRLSAHFGHCEQFTVVTIENGAIQGSEALTPPAHEPGALPRWLHNLGVGVIIAGGMGRRAQAFFEDYGIEVVVGAASEDPLTLAKAYLDGALATGDNICDH